VQAKTYGLDLGSIDFLSPVNVTFNVLETGGATDPFLVTATRVDLTKRLSFSSR
jgi:hypothetical protein